VRQAKSICQHSQGWDRIGLAKTKGPVPMVRRRCPCCKVEQTVPAHMLQMEYKTRGRKTQ
jgi:hypothetical protein